MKFRNIIIYLFLGVLLAGCLKVQKKSQEIKDQDYSKQAQPEIVTILSRQDIKTVYMPTAKPNNYNIVFKWPRFKGEIRILNDKKNALSHVIKNENEFLMNNFEGGQKQTFYFETINPEMNLHSEIELEIMPPKDLVLSGTFFLRESTRLVANRIFITDDTKIHNQSYDLDISFSQLILGKNVIISPFPFDQRAQLNTDGRSSGNIKIQGDQAFGNLNVFMNSEGGGNGSEGSVSCRSGWLEATCQGHSGMNAGAIGTAIIEIADTQSLVMTGQVLHMSGGAAGLKFQGSSKDGYYLVCANNPHHVIDPLICNALPVEGTLATGGKICFKPSRESAYECKE